MILDTVHDPPTSPLTEVVILTVQYLFVAVLFAADVRVTFDDYKKAMVATANSKTVITVNPGKGHLFMARELIYYAASASSSSGLPTFCQPFTVQMYKNTVHLP